MNEWFLFGKDEDFDRGVRLFEQQSYAEAAEAFEATLLNPTEPALKLRARNYLAICLQKLSLNDPEIAITLLGRAVELNPNFADLRHNLAFAYWECGNASAAKQHNEFSLKLNPHFDAALALQEVLKEGPNEALLHRCKTRESVSDALARSREFVRQRKPEDALECLEEVLLQHTNYADVRYHYANVLIMLDRLEEAAVHLHAAIRINPEYADAWAQLGIVWRRMNQSEHAREAFQKALTITPNHPVASSEILR